MAKTFDNVSEASVTNYLFLFAQRTLALQNEPPTPPPLNALGLPANAMFQLWGWLQKKEQTEGAENHEKSRAETTAGEMTEKKIDAADRATETATSGIKAAAEEASRNSARSSRDSNAEDAGAVAAQLLEKEEATAKLGSEAQVKTLTERIASLAHAITEYIINHQDDAAQEDRWRTTMKRDMNKSFRDIGNSFLMQREDAHYVKVMMQTQREEIHNVKEEVQKRLAKMDGMLDLLVKNLAGQNLAV